MDPVVIEESMIRVGFYNKASDKRGLKYAEAVDEALCWGWIDGVKKKVDARRYTNRFTPRKAVSKWSDANLRRYAELTAADLVAPPGVAAFERFDPSKHRAYSFEARPEAFPSELDSEFRKHRTAWAFFARQPQGYRRTAIHRVSSAKRDETRHRRPAELIESSAQGERLPQLSGRPARKNRS